MSELLRVVRERIVLVTMDVEKLAELWVVRDYSPELLGEHAARFPSINRVCELLPHAHTQVLPVPDDCEDGFPAAFWARPHAYLDPARSSPSWPGG